VHRRLSTTVKLPWAAVVSNAVDVPLWRHLLAVRVRLLAWRVHLHVILLVLLVVGVWLAVLVVRQLQALRATWHE